MEKPEIIKLKDAQKRGAEIAKTLKGGEILALSGPLGAGKTTFVKALAKALGIKQNVKSPTFTLMQVFRFTLQKKPAILYHLDIYRLNEAKDAEALGITENWGKKDTVTVIEWADKIKNSLPSHTQFLEFKH